MAAQGRREGVVPVPVSPEALLTRLSTARDLLARGIARENIGMQSAAIGAAAGRIVLGLLTLAIAEDRGHAEHGTLRAIRDAGDPAGALARLYRRGNIALTDVLPDERPVPAGKPVIGQETMDAVFRQFLPAEQGPGHAYPSTEVIATILGEYLRRTIRRSAAHQAVITDTQDALLSGGIPPAPLPLVRYVCRTAVQDACARRAPDDPLPFRIIDPACGAGAALLLSFKELLARHRGRMDPDERRQLLLDSIYGVDLDPRAAAAARLLLITGLSEGEPADGDTEAFLAQAGETFAGLRHSVLCGNALIGTDIACEEAWAFCPPRERHRLRPFDWAAAFPEVMAAGGFDLAVGIPPSGPVERGEWIAQYYQRHYTVFHPHADRSAFFFERCLPLLRPAGSLGFVTGGRWLRGSAGSALRHLLSSRQVREIVQEQGGTEPAGLPGPCGILAGNHPAMGPLLVTEVASGSPADPCRVLAQFPLDAGALDERGWVLRDTRADLIVEKACRAGTPLGNYVLDEPACAMVPGDVPVITAAAREALLREDPGAGAFLRPFVDGPSIRRYGTAGPPRYAVVIPAGWTAKQAGGAARNPETWLAEHRPALARCLGQSGNLTAGKGGWGETPGDAGYSPVQRKSLLFPARFRYPVWLPDDGRTIPGAGACVLPHSDRYLAGILNSRLLHYLFQTMVRKSAPEKTYFSYDDIRDLPVYLPDHDDPVDRARHDRLSALAGAMADHHRHLRTASGERERRLIRQEIDSLDRQIDSLVYGLYGLSVEEIAFLESALPGRSSP